MIRPRRTTTVLVVVLTICTLLTTAGCQLLPRRGAKAARSPAVASTTRPAASPSTPAPASPSASSSSPSGTTTVSSSASPSGASCSGLTGQQALEKWLQSSVPPEAKSALDYSTYDACAPLSWIGVWYGGASGSSPWDIMLFHNGQFVRLATDEPLAFKPLIARNAPGAIQVTYTFRRPGESNAAASGKAVSTFTWDDATKKVGHGGDWPPSYSPKDASPSAKVSAPAEAFPGAGGARPANATPVKSVAADGVRYFKLPSGNIGCDLSDTYPACGVDSWRTDRPYGPPAGQPGNPKWWVSLSGSPTVVGKGDPAHYHLEPSPQVLQYGESVYYGPTVCGAAENGLTCWNVNTGHGAFISREGYKAF